MVLVTHDPSLAARCDREIPVRSGRIEESAKGGAVLEKLVAGA
jgi:putative ABC transport system ATP-binding protein